jgi:hypothetical protein
MVDSALRIKHIMDFNSNNSTNTKSDFQLIFLQTLLLLHGCEPIYSLLIQIKLTNLLIGDIFFLHVSTSLFTKHNSPLCLFCLSCSQSSKCKKICNSSVFLCCHGNTKRELLEMVNLGFVMHINAPIL